MPHIPLLGQCTSLTFLSVYYSLDILFIKHSIVKLAENLCACTLSSGEVNQILNRSC